MKLKTLLKDLPNVEVRGSKMVEITGISSDSRTLKWGDLFIAKSGTVHKGEQFIHAAILAGASGVVTDLYDPFCSVAQIITKSPEQLEPILAARFYDHPSKELFVVGVTGTKGKTTTTYLIHHLLNGLNKRCGLMNSVETILPHHRFSSFLTTHDVIYNQKMLREMIEQSCKAACLEVSSHGVHQRRIDEISFDIALFTNLFPDHLDYHVTMEEYAQAKKGLMMRAKRVIVNSDSPWASFMKDGKQGLSFGLNPGADLLAFDFEQQRDEISFSLSFKGQTQQMKSSLMGQFNVYNILGAVAVGLEIGEPLDRIVALLSSFKEVPGRLQLVETRCCGIKVFVDHAHTEEALYVALETLSQIKQNRLFVVFGCGGNRDPQRRAGMARSAEKWADQIFITNDNPRKEDEQEICRQILSGFNRLDHVTIELDRKQAIGKALAMAQSGDIVLVAGKGHEKVQIFGSRTIPFDDVEVVQTWLHE